MKIPNSASDPIPETGEEEAYIINKYAGKEFLTPLEAVDCINELSGILLVDGNQRRHKQSKPAD